MFGQFLFPRLMERINKLEARIQELESTVERLSTGGIGRLNDYLTFHDESECVTARLTGINLQIVNGEGNTQSVNCKGNLILGYNEPHTEGTVERSGSHNLIIGIRHNYSSYCGIVNGMANNINGEYGTILNGRECYAHASHVTMCGGIDHKGNGSYSTLLSGFDNGGLGSRSVFIEGTNNRAEHSQTVFIGGVGETSSHDEEIIPALP
ncbi:hypothetical protein [Candidatus Thiodiazotropha sp. CDECU1]|uniref:hypothetical protein n=1 Tax=Candidatus Thiodiazotropha sp. CDECU1 TaxID=3065865 RepID=UPI00292DC151|nr:hypothetical protein [Candidatus Thiodiazotropha sp. CDECU1]